MSHDHHAQRARHDAPHVTAFITKIVPIARGVKALWGVPIAVLVAQAALESAWGMHVKGNAYFGIKGHAPSGGSITFTTHEVLKGRSKVIQDSFRAYINLQDAADDYGRLLRSNPRYASCFAYGNDPDRFVDHLARAGYATDLSYARKVKSIIHAHGLAAYDRDAPRP